MTKVQGPTEGLLSSSQSQKQTVVRDIVLLSAGVAAASFAAACVGHLTGAWALTGTCAILATVSSAAWMPVLIASCILAISSAASLISLQKAPSTRALLLQPEACVSYDPRVDLEREAEIAEYMASQELAIQEQAYRDWNKALSEDLRDHPFDPSDASSVASEEIQSWLEDERNYVSGFDFVQEEERSQQENQLPERRPNFPSYFTAQQMRGMQYWSGSFRGYPGSSSEG